MRAALGPNRPASDELRRPLHSRGGAAAIIFVAERVALTLGVRLHHVSNADRCSDNDGINSVIGIAGVSYFLL